MTKAAQKTPETFESAMTELETIVRKLEAADVPLEETITLYERGEFLRTFCEKKLREAELRVEEIQKKSE